MNEEGTKKPEIAAPPKNPFYEAINICSELSDNNAVRLVAKQRFTPSEASRLKAIIDLLSAAHDSAGDE